MAAGRVGGPPAVGGRAGPPVRPLPGGGGRGRGAGPVVRVRPASGGPEPAAVPVSRRVDRDGVPAPSGGGGGVSARPLRSPPRREPQGREPQGVGPDRPRAGDDRPAGVPRLLPDRVGHRPVLRDPRHLLPGSGVGRQQCGVLGVGHHQGRRRGPGPAVRAVPVARAGRAARHRPRHRERPPGGGDPVRLRALRPSQRGPGGQRDHLPVPLRGARHGQGPGGRPGPAGRLVQAARPVEAARGPDRRGGRQRDPRRGAGAGPGGGALPPAPGHPLRGDGGVRPAGDRGVPGGVGPHGRSQRAPVGQGRLRGRGAGEVRPVGTGHVERPAPHGRPGGGVERRAHRPGHPAPGPRGLRDVVPGRFGGGVPGGVPGPDGHPAPAAAPHVLRPGGGGGVDPTGSDPGRVGAPLHPAPQRQGAGHLPAPPAGAVAGQDPGGAAVPGAAHADGHRRGRVQPGRGRPAPPGHGVQAVHRAHGAAASPAVRGHGRAGHHWGGGR